MGVACNLHQGEETFTHDRIFLADIRWGFVVESVIDLETIHDATKGFGPPFGYPAIAAERNVRNGSP